MTMLPSDRWSYVPTSLAQRFREPKVRWREVLRRKASVWLTTRVTATSKVDGLRLLISNCPIAEARYQHETPQDTSIEFLVV
jgi:hypothetical protein